MRFIVYGAGAVGGVVAARLHQHGHEVALIARGAHLEAIRRNGLRLQSADEDVALPIPAFATPTDIEFREDDVVLLGVKSQDTVDAQRVRSRRPPRSLPSCHSRTASPTSPRCCGWFANVYGVCVMAPTAHVEAGSRPGQQRRRSAGCSTSVATPDGVDGTATEIADALRRARFESIAATRHHAVEVHASS